MTRSQSTPASSQIITLEKMLQERDAEIERLTLGWNAANVDVLYHAMTIDAQRKVLEQALEALENLQGIDTGTQGIEDVTIWCPEVIAAIQEQLK